MLVVHGTFHINPDAVEDLRDLLAPLQAATRRETGCVLYDWAQSLEEPGTFYSVEIWSSREDSDAHMKSDHVRSGFADMPAMMTGPPQVIGFDGGEQVNLLS